MLSRVGVGSAARVAAACGKIKAPTAPTTAMNTSMEACRGAAMPTATRLPPARSMSLLGHMSDQPLLISSLMEYAAKFHPDVEVVTRDVDDPDLIHRYTYGDAAGRMMQLANALHRLGVKDGMLARAPTRV